MEKHNEPPPRDVGLERLIFLCDGVFAIAITLLALDLRVPALPRGLTSQQASAELLRALLEQGGSFLGFLISFLVIGTYWVGHHRIFRHILGYDRRFIWINLFFLMCIVLIPFASGLLGAYGQLQVTTILYAALFIVTGLVLAWAWWYATHNHRLVANELDPRIVRGLKLQSLIAPAVFALSVLISFIGNDLAKIAWSLLLVIALFRRVE